MSEKITATIINGKLTIEIPVNDPLVPSSTKKTLLVANSRGPQRTDVDLDGKPVYIAVNAYVYPN